MTPRYLGTFVIIFFMTACNNPSQKEKNRIASQQQKKISRKYIANPPSSFEDTLTIKTVAAVFFKPDSNQLQKIKAVNKPMVFASLTHDCHFQMGFARNELSKNYPKIKIINTDNARYLLFVKDNKSDTCIDLNKNNDICGVYIFNRLKNPQLLDMTNADTELEFYFKK
jgi:hypothetical protein